MTNATPPGPSPDRVVALDAYRGWVMFLMMAEVLALGSVARALPESGFWQVLAFHQSHVEWVGCSLHDLIQPSFSFLVGVALPFSIASRVGRGQSKLSLVWHAAWRALVLVALGIFLRSLGRAQTNFTFEDTLTQIGLGYFFLFLVGLAAPRWQWPALGALLVAYWAAFALFPLPGPGFDWQHAGVDPAWAHNLQGFAAHWNKNTNLAWSFDQWFLNLFPRERPFLYNGGGYATLSFIPTLGTMLLGLVAGRWLQGAWPERSKLWRMVVAGLAGLAFGWFLDWAGICPVVKRIWTPAWVLFSGGWCFLWLAFFYGLTEVLRLRRWAFPWTVIGMNSIAAYCLADAGFRDWVQEAWRRHLPAACFSVFGAAYAPLVLGMLTLLVLWLVLFWMWRRRLFLRI